MTRRIWHSYTRLFEERFLADNHATGAPRWYLVRGSRSPRLGPGTRRDDSHPFGYSSASRDTKMAVAARLRLTVHGGYRSSPSIFWCALVGPNTRARPPQRCVSPDTFPIRNTHVPILAIFLTIYVTNDSFWSANVLILSVLVMDLLSRPRWVPPNGLR